MIEDGTWDVLVLGGGSAGLAAAVAAARAGARTLLIERHGYCGGMGTASLVHSFCGLYLLRDAPGAVAANPGIAEEIAGRMEAATGMGPRRMGRVDVLPQHPVEFVALADAMVAAEPRLTAVFHAECIGLAGDGDGWRVDIAGRGGLRGVAARVVVDASGDAVAADFLKLDAGMAEAPRLQRPAYVFGVHGVAAQGEDEALRIAGLVVEGVRAGVVDAGAMGVAFRPSGRAGETFGTIDLEGAETGGEYDPCDDGVLTALETRGRAIAMSVTRWLVARHPGWRGAYISHWPARAGVRESRRWHGEAVITRDDILEGRRHADEVCLATWPMEFRENARGPKLVFPRENRAAGIRIGCLRPRGIDRLWVAGRCLSADHDAQASIRVMGTCFATGEAAGLAAANEAAGNHSPTPHSNDQ